MRVINEEVLEQISDYHCPRELGLKDSTHCKRYHFTCKECWEFALTEESSSISIVWNIEDILAVRSDLKEEQAREVLKYIKKNHDSAIGINWEVIEDVADMLYEEEEIKC